MTAPMDQGELFTGEPPAPESRPAQQSRADQIFHRFCEFHRQNPDIWRVFEARTLDLIRRGRTHYSVDAIMHVVRWEVDIATTGETVKLNDHYTAYYARLFQERYPEHGRFFETRRRTSQDRAPFATDIPVYDVGPAGDEDTLHDKLQALLKEMDGV